jgi:hypothetical protein
MSTVAKRLTEGEIKYGEEFTGSAFYLFVYGLGLGLQLEPLIRHYKPKVLVIVEESRDNFVHASSVIDWESIWRLSQELGTTIKLTIEKDPIRIHEGVKTHIMSSSLMGLDGLHVFNHGYSSALKQASALLMDPKSANLASFMGFITDEYNMMKNSFRNLRHGTKRLIGPAKEKCYYPVLIVGSGPSLEENMEWLRNNRDKFILISSGSSLAVLLKNGVRSDFHCNLERAQSILERHEELVQQGYADELKQIYAVMTTTIWPGVDQFFKDTVYFLRPALSPLGVFAENFDQVLFNEGPQVTNTAFAFARRLAAKEIYLLGVDLGTTNPDLPRAKDAWKGIRPRQLTIPLRGNKGKTVFTDMALVQQKDTLEAQIRKLNDIGGHCYNLGTGVQIRGAKPAETTDIVKEQLTIDREKELAKMVEQFPVYTREKFLTNWTNEVVRESVARFINELILKLSQPGWTNDMIYDLEAICSYANKPLRAQYAPRLIRGSLLRIFLHSHGIIQRLIDKESQDKSIAAIKEVLVDTIRGIEREAYALADELESEDTAFG